MAKHPRTALVPYLRDELATDERARVARHLEACAKCRELRDSIAEMSADLAHWIEQMPVPALSSYRAQLERKLATRQAPEPRSWRPRLAWFSIAAAGAGAIALLSMLNIRSRPIVPPVEQLATENEMADAGIELLRDFPVLTHLDLLENYDVIEHLNELPEANNQSDTARA